MESQKHLTQIVDLSSFEDDTPLTVGLLKYICQRVTLDSFEIACNSENTIEREAASVASYTSSLFLKSLLDIKKDLDSLSQEDKSKAN